MHFTDIRHSARAGWRMLVAATHNGFAMFGLLAVLFLVLEGDRHLGLAWIGGNAVEAAEIVIEPKIVPDVQVVPDPNRRLLAGYLARKYRVAAEATEDLVTQSYVTGRELGLDPLLILAVMAIESRFNPIAQSEFGAMGLMQVVPRFHQDKLAGLGGEDSVLHPRTNIVVGAQILKDAIRRGGSVEAGLQLYAGAAEDQSGSYAQKVMAEQQRLRQAIGARAGHKSPTDA